MQKKYPKILFFIKGSVPTEDDIEEAEKLGFNVCFRNALFVDDGSNLEICDGVAGHVPGKYAALPSGEEALSAFFESRAKSEKLPTREEQAPELAKVPEPEKTPETGKPVSSSKASKKPVVWQANKPSEKEV